MQSMPVANENHYQKLWAMLLKCLTGCPGGAGAFYVVHCNLEKSARNSDNASITLDKLTLLCAVSSLTSSTATNLHLIKISVDFCLKIWYNTI